MSLEGIEANLAHFTESSHFLSTWLQQKEKMLTALGPIATEPNMVKSQLHQVQVNKFTITRFSALFYRKYEIYEYFVVSNMHPGQQGGLFYKFTQPL